MDATIKVGLELMWCHHIMSQTEMPYKPMRTHVRTLEYKKVLFLRFAIRLYGTCSCDVMQCGYTMSILNQPLPLNDIYIYTCSIYLVYDTHLSILNKV